MGYERTEYPVFSWSYTRDRTLTACARRYYWHYYGSHNGWERRAAPEGRRAWHLKQLTTYQAELGSAIHERAHEIALAVSKGEDRPSFSVLYHRTRNALNALYLRCKSLDQFVEDPRRHSVTWQAYYGYRIAADQFPLLARKLRVCLTNLVSQQLWSDLQDAASLGTLRIHLFDSAPSIVLDGVMVYAQPDLVFHTPAAGWVVIDWKTGFADNPIDQIALYCLFVRQSLRLRSDEEGYECRVVHLSTDETRTFRMTERDIEDCAERIRDRVAAMRQFLVTPSLNAPRDLCEFPLTPNRKLCRSCNFLELCEDELAGLAR